MIEEFSDWLSATFISVAFQNLELVGTLDSDHSSNCDQRISRVCIRHRSLSTDRLYPLAGFPIATMTANSAPWIWGALCVLLATGVLVTVTEPSRELLNWAFRAKMVLVLLLAGVLLALERSLGRNPLYSEQGPGRRLAERGVGIAALLIGASIVTAGRWIAYVQWPVQRAGLKQWPSRAPCGGCRICPVFRPTFASPVGFFQPLKQFTYLRWYRRGRFDAPCRSAAARIH